MKDYTKRVPEEYYKPFENGGRIDEFFYDTSKYSTDMSPLKKRALVYLPKEYDDNADREYKVLYLMHGGGGSEEEFLYGQDNAHHLIHIIDHMMASGELEPMIIVAPTFYYEPTESAGHDVSICGVLTATYDKELRNELIPAAESRYRIKADRESRAFGGFSMGSVTTWVVFMNCLDLVANFLPMSGDSWIIEEKGGSEKCKETVDAISAKIKPFLEKGYKYNIFAATGEKDIAFPNLNPQIERMKEEGFGTNGNSLRYVTWEEGTHCYQYIYEYMYNILPDLFI